MELPLLLLEQSTWCYWFQRIFWDWQLESLHRSVTALPRKLEKWYSKWRRIENRCHPLKDQDAAARAFIQRGFERKWRLLRTNFIVWRELRRSGSLSKQGSAWSVCQPFLKSLCARTKHQKESLLLQAKSQKSLIERLEIATDFCKVLFQKPHLLLKKLGERYFITSLAFNGKEKKNHKAPLSAPLTPTSSSAHTG